jgi:DNA polymerase III subunit beta
MQLIKTNRDTLLRPLQTVTGIVERRHTLPILANILIRKQGNTISLLSTDIEIQITTHGEFGVDGEDISTTVAARKLLDILRALPDSEVNVSLLDKRLTVQAGKSRFTLQTLPAEDFPTVSPATDYAAPLTLTQKSLKQLLALTHFAMAQHDIRYYLNGMLLVAEGQNITSVSTDGHRLAYATCNSDSASLQERRDVIVPRKTILELQRLLDDSDEPVHIALASNQVKFSFGSVELISKLVEGKFPDYQRVIPRGYKNTFTIARQSLLSSLQRANILTSEKFKGVRWILEPNLLKIQATNPEHEEGQEEIEINYQGESVDIGFNVTYLLDVLSNLKTDQIQIAFGNATSSALITVPEEESFKYVVMPMRI